MTLTTQIQLATESHQPYHQSTIIINPALRYWFSNKQGYPSGQGPCSLCGRMCHARYCLTLRYWDDENRRWLDSDNSSVWGHYDCVLPHITPGVEILESNLHIQYSVFVREMPAIMETAQ